MGHGGRRPGAGAKPREYSKAAEERSNKAIQKWSKESGRTPEDIEAEILCAGKFFGHLVPLVAWQNQYSNYCNRHYPRRSQKEIEITDRRVVILPEIKRPKEDEVAQA